IEKVKGRQKIDEDDDLSDNVYNVGEKIFDMLSKCHVKKESRHIAEKLKNNNKSMHNKKHEFNKKIAELVKHTKQLRTFADEIDNERTILKNTQFKAERTYEDVKTSDPEKKDPKSSPQVKELIEDFEAKQKNCKTLMKKFLDSDLHVTLLTGLDQAYVKLYKETLSEVSK
ncbi:MAG: hypothetical protein ACRDDF_06655, partial [Aeromonas sp.]